MNVHIEEPKTFLDKFLFTLAFQIAKESSSGTNSDFILPLISRTEKLVKNLKKVFIDKNEIFWEENKFIVIQLADCNGDMNDIIPSLVSKMIFERAVDKKGDKDISNSITNILIDEAHNLLYSDFDNDNYHKTTIDVFEKIVKEGRKFGVFLTISSQRPSDISNKIDLSNNRIHLSLDNMDDEHKDISLAFARTINTASQKKLEELRKLLLESDEK